MTPLTPLDATALVALQRGLPFVHYPFDTLAEQCGASSGQALIEYVKQLKADGTIRRVGGVFDTRRLGYVSALCAVRVPKRELADIAARVTPLRGVTHCYERTLTDVTGAPAVSTYPNLWFTLSEPADQFEARVAMIADALPYALYAVPATRRFKVDVVFDVATRARDEEVMPRGADDGAVLPVWSPTEEERAIIRALQGDLPVARDFYAPVAAAAGITVDALLAILTRWQAAGIVRRVGVLLNHREAGFKANGMCCWNLSSDLDALTAGRRLAACPEVTHCYERPQFAFFPFRLYAMIHTSSFAGTYSLFQKIGARAGLSDGIVLVSRTEFKKTSMTFF